MFGSLSTLSKKEKMALQMIQERGFVFIQDLRLVYSSMYNLKNCLQRLSMMGLIKKLEGGKFMCIEAYEEQQKLIMKNQ